jgi:hypothetical protein
MIGSSDGALVSKATNFGFQQRRRNDYQFLKKSSMKCGGVVSTFWGNMLLPYFRVKIFYPCNMKVQAAFSFETLITNHPPDCTVS